MKLNAIIFSIVFSLLLFGAFPAVAEEKHEHQPYVGSEAFESVKQLVGLWEATMDMGKGPMKITASYRLTSGGSAIVETVFEGGPMEMMSVYHDNSNKMLTMVHYCAEHNQPKLILTSMKDNRLTMELSGDNDIDVANETHIHAATISFNGKDGMTQEWTSFEKGKMQKAIKIDYIRIKG